MNDIFDENFEVPESEDVGGGSPPQSSKVCEDDGTRPAMATAKILGKMLSDSQQLHEKSVQLDALRLSRQADFLLHAEAQGFSGKEMVAMLKEAIDIARKKGDSRALTRLMELSSKMLLEPASDMSKFFLQLQQNNIKYSSLNKTKGDDELLVMLNNLPDHVVKAFMSNKIKEYMKDG